MAQSTDIKMVIDSFCWALAGRGVQVGVFFSLVHGQKVNGVKTAV